MIAQIRQPRPASWASYGIDLPPHEAGQVRTVCPTCSASRRKSHDRCLAVNTDLGVWYCWHCGWRGRLRGQHYNTRHVPADAQPHPQLDERKWAALNRVWGEAFPLKPSDAVTRYLCQRNILLPSDDLPRTLRYHPHLRYQHDDGTVSYHPAMLARVDAPDGSLSSIHRTYLAQDGSKASVEAPRKLMAPALPGSIRGAALRLYAAGETLAVAEGIETALAVRFATQLPVWSTICARGMADLIVPVEVRLAVIAADHDTPGLNAARALARRLLEEHRRVKILIPPRPGTDWLDAVVGHG
jgi:putative DNA primase/helicase